MMLIDEFDDPNTNLPPDLPGTDMTLSDVSLAPNQLTLTPIELFGSATSTISTLSTASSTTTAALTAIPASMYSEFLSASRNGDLQTMKSILMQVEDMAGADMVTIRRRKKYLFTHVEVRTVPMLIDGVLRFFY
jgi:hypothetical protein